MFDIVVPSAKIRLATRGPDIVHRQRENSAQFQLIRFKGTFVLEAPLKSDGLAFKAKLYSQRDFKWNSTQRCVERLYAT